MQALVHAATNAAPACPPASLFLRSMNSPGVSRLPVILHFYAPGAGAAALAFAGSPDVARSTSSTKRGQPHQESGGNHSLVFRFDRQR